VEQAVLVALAALAGKVAKVVTLVITARQTAATPVVAEMAVMVEKAETVVPVALALTA
jgi:hypothetical protein